MEKDPSVGKGCPHRVHLVVCACCTGTIAIVYPKGFNTLKRVSICGVACIRSRRAMAGCFKPDISASRFCDMPFCSRASISFPTKSILSCISSFSACVNKVGSFHKSSNVVNVSPFICILILSTKPFYKIFQIALTWWCFKTLKPPIMRGFVTILRSI